MQFKVFELSMKCLRLQDSRISSMSVTNVVKLKFINSLNFHKLDSDTKLT